VLNEQEDIQLLTDIGLTKTQAKLYLALLKRGQTDGSTLGKDSDVPRQIVYRTLDELQKIGLVQKNITRPYTFKATPLKYGLQIIMSQRRQQYNEIQKKAKNFLQKMSKYKEEKGANQEYNFSIVEGRERISQIIKLQHTKVKREVNALSTLTRWLHIIHYCHDEIRRTLDRKVKYHIVLEIPNHEITFPENMQALMKKPNFKLRTSKQPLTTNSAVFDDREASFNFFPSKPMNMSPILVTNHPSFIAMCRDHFNKEWKTAQAIDPAQVN
jgi:sugar-specific transcriptional regulator TrmB